MTRGTHVVDVSGVEVAEQPRVLRLLRRLLLLLR